MLADANMLVVTCVWLADAHSEGPTQLLFAGMSNKTHRYADAKTIQIILCSRCGNKFAARTGSRQTVTLPLVKRSRFNPCVQPRLSLTRLRKHLYAFILWITEYLVHPCQPKCGSSRSNYGYGLWRVLEVFASDSIRLDDIDKPAIAEQSQRIGQPVTNVSS